MATFKKHRCISQDHCQELQSTIITDNKNHS